MIPRATYRLQFHRHFTFDDAGALAPYLAALGVSHVYASPILVARPGSMHGYDVIDHARVNDELGGEEGFRRFCATLAAHGLKLIVDIVPNHMAAHADNAWWFDVLEKGEASKFSRYFDIDWHPGDPELDGRVLLPFLGEPYGHALRDRRLSIGIDEIPGRLVIRYYEQRFPLRVEDHRDLGGPRQANLKVINTPDVLHRLLQRQHFRLCWWRTAADAINWRRFFNINDLVALRIEDPEVFEAVHAKIFSLVAEGLIDGVRVDHVDGLADPAGYCCRLRARLDSTAPRARPFIVVEKILGIGERLPKDWQIDGTTGYDFLNDVSALLHDPRGMDMLTDTWRTCSGRDGEFPQEARAARRDVATRQFASSLGATARAFRRLAATSPQAIDLTESALRRALVRLIVEMQTYRTYATGRDPYASRQFDSAIATARRDASKDDLLALSFVQDKVQGWDVAGESDAADAVRRFNQLASAVAAKAVEDTALYRYGRILSRNDVGCFPEQFSLPIEEFHARAIRRVEEFPHALLATATHDHKWGEDARARLAVLSELAMEWAEEAGHWLRLNKDMRDRRLNLGDEYQLYQALVGSWPVELRPADPEGLARFAERVVQWRIKSLREARLRSSWSEPDIDYELASAGFIRMLLDAARSPEFLTRLHAFVDRISPAAALNSFVQATLRCTLPGVPDLYQGAELWDFSLVDPDNRRPVDYSARESSLRDRHEPAALLARWKDGRFKHHTIQGLLNLRKDMPSLFGRGHYVPLDATGPNGDRVLAFARVDSGHAVVVAVPLHCAPACLVSGRPLPAAGFWEGTEIAFARELDKSAWRSLFDRGSAFENAPRLSCADLFARFPVAVLIGS